MASILTRLANRRRYPVTIGGETFHLRALTLGELDTVDKLPPDLKSAFAIACALVDDDGNQAMPRGKVPTFAAGSPEADAAIAAGVPNEPRDQTHEEYGAFCLDALSIVPGDSLVAIIEQVWKICKTPPVEDLIKN